MFTLFSTVYGTYGSSNGIEYVPNEYFTHQLDSEHILLTTRHRAWVILNPEEYELLLCHRLHAQPALFSLLEDLGIILTSRNASNIASAFCQRYAFLHYPPSLFIMVPTLRCNLSCVYCHAKARSASAHKYDMSEEVLYKTVDFFLAVPRGRRREIRIEFQGGEPLLRYDLVQKAMDYATEKAQAEGIKTQFAIVSNLTLLTDEIAQNIQERGNVNICSSLDGPASVHDKQRVYPNGKGTHTDVIRSANKLQDLIGKPTPFLPTFTTHSLGNEHTIVEEFLERGLPDVYFRYVNCIGRAFESGYDVGITVEQFLDAWKTTLDYILEKNHEGVRVRERLSVFLLGNMLSTSYTYMCIRRPCGCGISQVVVEHDGTLYGCDGSRSVEMLAIGNVLTHTYDEAYTSETVRALRTLANETLPMCRSCAFSPYCGYCVARGINQHGNPIPTTPKDFECQIYREVIPHLFRKLLDRKTALILMDWVRREYHQ